MRMFRHIALMQSLNEGRLISFGWSSDSPWAQVTVENLLWPSYGSAAWRTSIFWVWEIITVQ